MESEPLPMWKKVVGVIGFIGALSSALPVYDSITEYVKGNITEYVHAEVDIKIKEAHSNEIGGYRSETSDELERLGHPIDRSDLPSEIAKVIVWVDSAKTFSANLEFENTYESIGLFRNKQTGFFWYRSPDSYLYRAYEVINIESEHHGYFRYLDKHGIQRIIWIPSH